MSIIGIAGTAKNTGKTTTLNSLLHQAQKLSASIGVTSIGYDGEEIDNITALPKPRIFFHHGMFASTSLSCVPVTGWNIVQRTGITTALGEIVIVRCETPGLLVLAGPNKRHELEIVLQCMHRFRCSTIIVDGSLNRIAPLSAVDTIIFTTGAARTTDISALVGEMKAIEFFFQFGISKQRNNQETSSINVGLDEVKNLTVSSELLTGAIIDAIEVEQLLQQYVEKFTAHHNRNLISINGFITSAGLQTLVEKILHMSGTERPREIIFSDPIVLLLAGEAQQTKQLLSPLRAQHITISYHKAIQLAAITVNPFYPEYRENTFSPASIDSALLLSTLQRSLRTPVYDIFKTGLPKEVVF